MDNSLARFLEAQARNYADALAELEAGTKRSHWMWYVFPQLAGLGLSPTARFYGIASREGARAYLAHPVLGPRLVASTNAVLSHPDRSLHAIFGSPDDMKFRSSMTLFAEAAAATLSSVAGPLHHPSGGPPPPLGEETQAADVGASFEAPLRGAPQDEEGGSIFTRALATFCDGTPCPRTLALLARGALLAAEEPAR